MKRIVMLFVVLCGIGSMYAEQYKVRTPDRFNDLIGEHEMMAVLFYGKDMHGAENAFERIGKEDRFAKSGVAFVRANVDKYEALMPVMRANGVGHMPAVILFQDGQRVSGALVGNITPSTLRPYLNKQFGDRIDKIREEQIKQREEARESRPRTSVYFGFGVGAPYYYGYPYYGYPYYGGFYGRGYYGGHRHHHHGGHRGGGRRR